MTSVALPLKVAPASTKTRFAWFNIWTLGALLVGAIVVLPIATIIYIAFTPGENIWGHLVATVLPTYIITTLTLMFGVGIGTVTIGVGTAWLAAMCSFPGKKIFEWALLLPLAMPAYVIAYVYTDILEYAGPVQGLLRDTFEWTSKRDYWFPEIRSTGGATLMMTLVLYPYVYILSRAAFLEQFVGVLEASRMLGRGPWRSFFSVALPLARPAVVVGVSLVLMETLNDFGTVDFFGVSTITLGIYDVWLNMNNVAGAAQLAGVVLLFVIFLISIERFARRKQKFHNTGGTYKTLPGYHLTGWQKLFAVLACALPVGLGFILPALILADNAVIYYDAALSAHFYQYALNSVMLSTLTATLAVFIGIFLAYAVRLRGERFLTLLVRFSSLGYAIPGAVLAVGVLVSLGGFDNSVDAFMRAHFGISTGLLLSGTIAAVTFGYVVRFLALSFGAVEASLEKITPNMDGAARSLGHGPWKTLIRVHMPLIRASILTAAIMVFVDCMKELPLTVILRPFNFHTLATFVHQYASDEQFGEASLAALAIVGFGIIPVIALSFAMTRARPGNTVEETGR